MDGKARYLGRYDDPKTQRRYDRLIAEWLEYGRKFVDPENGETITVNRHCDAFMVWAIAYYKLPDGKPTSEINTFERFNKPMVDKPATTSNDGGATLATLFSDSLRAG